MSDTLKFLYQRAASKIETDRVLSLSMDGRRSLALLFRAPSVMTALLDSRVVASVVDSTVTERNEIEMLLEKAFLTVTAGSDFPKIYEIDRCLTVYSRMGFRSHGIRVLAEAISEGRAVASSQPATDRKKLPPKKRDLEQVPGINLDVLTERQHEILSLSIEYELNVSHIAAHLGLTRKTVDEHLAAARRRLDNYRDNHSAHKRSGRAEEDTMVEFLDSNKE